MDNKIPKGGFPPIKYCKKKIIKKTLQKERFFAPTENISNINIRKILLHNNNSKILDNNNNIEEDELDIVE